jgi:hypothetical protein
MHCRGNSKSGVLTIKLKIEQDKKRYTKFHKAVVLHRMRWAGHVARMREKRNAYRILAGKPEGKRPLGRPSRRWVYNIKMDLREIEWDGVDWIDMVQDRDKWRALVKTILNIWVP